MAAKELIIPGATAAERYAYLMSRLSRSERLQMAQRRADRLAWLAEHNPDALRTAA
jgi:hypothetical protein